MASGLPFDDFRGLLAGLPGPDEAAAARTAHLFERFGGAGSRLAEIAVWLARWSGRQPAVNRPSVALFAGTHGVAARGVSTRPVEATAATVAACGAGDAGVNHLASAHSLGLKVYDLALHLPTGDICAEAAMDERNCAATMAFGMEAIAGGPDLMLIGSIRSTGDATVAATLLAALFRGAAADWTPASAGSDVAQTRLGAVETALAFHGANLRDPLEALRRVGGREFAAMAGAILAARIERIPVVIDGLSALAAAAVLHAANPSAVAHCQLAEAPDEMAARAAARLGLAPMLAGSYAAGEGVSAALAAGIVRDAASLFAGYAAQARTAPRS